MPLPSEDTTRRSQKYISFHAEPESLGLKDDGYNRTGKQYTRTLISLQMF